MMIEGLIELEGRTRFVSAGSVRSQKSLAGLTDYVSRQRIEENAP
jgi:hypothetical protein